MHSSAQAIFGLFCAVVCTLKWLLAFCAKNTHGLRVCRCSRRCSRASLCWLVGCWSSWWLVLQSTPVLHLPRGLRCLWHCQQPAGLSSADPYLCMLVQQHDLNSCTMIESVENLESVALLPLSPPPADICFYFNFPAPSKEVLMHDLHKKEISKSYFSDNQWKVAAVCGNLLMFVGKKLQLTLKVWLQKRFDLCVLG